MSVTLIFAGRIFIKVLVFILAGIAGAALGGYLGGMLLQIVGSIVGSFLGFIVGGILGVVLIRLGIGLALGYFGYSITRHLTGIFAFALLVGALLFIVGILLADRMVELFTAFLGALLLFGVLAYLGASPAIAALVAVTLGIVGFYVQLKRPKQQG
ncbi:MAG: hypothetical protein HYU03_06290 [Thaumarchaeota archaeon]|nr:hypothetical protein [Nitrososphaerota archaeon]